MIDFIRSAEKEAAEIVENTRLECSDREKQARRVEREITKTEARIAEIEVEYEANASDYKKLMELDAERGELNEKLDALYLEWEELDES